MNGRTWTAAEISLLEELYGEVTVGAIAGRLGRTVGSVHNRATLMRLGRARPGDVMSLNEVMKGALGSDNHQVVIRWIREGLLPATRGNAYGIRNREWWIRVGDLETFLVAHPHLVDRDKVLAPFDRLLTERWISLVEAFRRGAAYPMFLEDAAKAGLVPEARKRGGPTGIWVIPESLLPFLVAARRRMTSEADHRRLVLAYGRHEQRSTVSHRKTYLNRRARELASGVSSLAMEPPAEDPRPRSRRVKTGLAATSPRVAVPLSPVRRVRPSTHSLAAAR